MGVFEEFREFLATRGYDLGSVEVRPIRVRQGSNLLGGREVEGTEFVLRAVHEDAGEWPEDGEPVQPPRVVVKKKERDA